jgi:aryl carrier-like protein
VIGRNDLDSQLLALWTEVFSIPQVAPSDDFFALGGSSLQAARLIARVRETFARDVSLRALFEHPTFSAFAEYVHAAPPVRGQVRQPSAASPPIFTTRASYTQEWAFLADEAAPEAPPFLTGAAYHLHGPLDVPALEHSLYLLGERHDALRGSFYKKAQQVHLRIFPESTLWLRQIVIDGTTAAERLAKAYEWLALERRRGFDRKYPPLLRASLLELAPHDHILSLVFDHLICDGWSLAVAVQDLSAAYLHATGQTTAPLTPLPMQFADWVHRQRTTLSGGRLASELRYWSSRLGGDPHILSVRLPGYQPERSKPYRAGTDRIVGSTATTVIDEPTTVRLQAYARAHGTTLFSILTACLAKLLGQELAASTIVMMTDHANRTTVPLQQLIGWFATAVWLPIQRPINTPLSQLASQVQTTMLEVSEHGQIHANLIREYIWPETWKDVAAEPTIYFVLDEPWKSGLTLGDVLVEPIEVVTDLAHPGIQIWATKRDDRVELKTTYATDDYDQRYINELLGRFTTIVRTAV